MRASPVSAEIKEVRVGQGVIRYREAGSGPPLVFVHGIMVNGLLWQKVIPHLAPRLRCITLDLPLGGHSVPFEAAADLSPRGIAGIVAGFLEALDLRDVILVGNDTGGAICQLVISDHPRRVAGLVLTNCDAYEAFLPPLLRPFQYGARWFGGGFVAVLAAALRFRPVQRLFLWTVSSSRVDPARLDAYFNPLVNDAGVRHDLTRFLRSVSNRYTLDAARTFGEFHRPVLIVWGKDDIFFSRRLATRLQRDFPEAALEVLPGSRTFVPEDQPRRLAALIEAFVRDRSLDARGQRGQRGKS